MDSRSDIPLSSSITPRPQARVLNKLLRINLDNHKAYRACAERLEEGSLRRLLKVIAQQRLGFANELRTELVRLDSQPLDLPRFSASFYQAWAETQEQTESDHETAMLQAAIQREKASIPRYTEALDNDRFKERLRELMRAHLHRMKDTLLHLERLLEKQA